jgi:hypothetical protein
MASSTVVFLMYAWVNSKNNAPFGLGKLYRKDGGL